MRRLGKRAGRSAVLDPKRLPTEHEEQREFVRWFRQNHPGVRIFAIPNGGARSITTAAKLKVEGVSAGVPDLCVPAWGMWIEMKRKKGGRVDEAQKDWHQYLTGIGHTVIIGKGWEDAKTKVKAWFVATYPVKDGSGFCQ